MNRYCDDVGCTHPASKHGGDTDAPWYCRECHGEAAKHSYAFVRHQIGDNATVGDETAAERSRPARAGDPNPDRGVERSQ